MKTRYTLTAVAFAVLALGGCETTQMRMGAPEAKTAATGAAGGAQATNANAALEKCERPYGTIALVEDQQADWYRILTTEYQLSSTAPVLRLLVQQSNCFIVVERGRAMTNIQQERALQQSGELRAGSNFGKGQLVSADYSLTPQSQFSARDAGGMGGALGGLGRGMGVVGALAGGIRQREAATMLTLVDNRSGVQVGAAEGSASKTDFDVGAAIFGSSAGGGLGGYTNTPQGKVIVAAFTDSYNQLVQAMRSYKPQTMGDRGLGTGGRLTVDGASQPTPVPAGATSPVKGAPSAASTSSGGTMSLAAAQRKLATLGYNPGPADGAMGGRTATALRSFQKDRNLPVTGKLDAQTIAELSK